MNFPTHIDNHIDNHMAARVKPFASLTPGELDFWQRTVEQNPQYQQAFLTAAFCEQVAKVDSKVRVVVMYAADTLVGVMPLRRHHGWLGYLGVYEPVAGAMTDYVGAVVTPGIVLHINNTLRSAGVGAVVFSHLDQTQSEIGLTGSDARPGLRTLIQGVGDAHWEYLRKLDKKLTSDTERRERKLVAEHGPLTFELMSSQPGKDFDELIVLKKAQYIRTGNEDAVLFDDTNVQLLRGLLQTATPECAGLLSVLRAGGKLVAAHFGLRHKNTLHFWFPAYAKEYAALSPGRILFRRILSEGSLHGLQVLDRGEGDNQAKRDFANNEHVYYSGIWWPRTARGYLARLAISAWWRLQRIGFRTH